MSEERNAFDAIVVGAGAIGCGIARELAGGGRTVVVVDPRAPGRQATWAAAGMLSPLAEVASSPPLLDLALDSLATFPDMVAALREETGIAVAYEQTGKLEVALGESRLAVLADTFDRHSSAHGGVGWLEQAEVLELEPHLSRTVRGGIRYAADAHVDNRRLGRALHRSAELRGVEFRIGPRVDRIETAGGIVEGVRLDDGSRIGADLVVLAAGAWTSRIGGSRPDVRPVRGQMLALVCEPLPLKAMVHTEDVYLIPRQGRLLVGATLEEVGFDSSLTDEGQAALFDGAARAIPAIADAPVVERWAGLRPGTPDALPMIGPDPEVRGVIYATGHYRNGILLTPVTVRLVAGLIDGTPSIPERLRPFDPSRFG